MNQNRGDLDPRDTEITAQRCVLAYGDNQSPVDCLAVLPNGKSQHSACDACACVCFGTFNQLVCPVISGRVASGSEDSAITAWNINSVSPCEDPLPPQLPIDTQTTHAEGTSVFCLAVMKDNTLASGCSNGSIKLWRGAQCEATLLGHSQVHTCNTN